VGAPDAVLGERVVAFVVLRAGHAVDARSLQLFARDRLADYKVPAKTLFLEELPRGLTGKVHRRTLMEMVMARPELFDCRATRAGA
jgi:acyl-CoA synthetase (AMP-forming)/AMP-acid ligase II